MQPSDEKRLADAESGAFELGHRLLTVSVANMNDVTHKAFVGRSTREVNTGRFLAYGTSPVDAAERGLLVLKGVVERGDRWPREPARP